MADQRIGWRFCPRCGVPWPMQRPERIHERTMICGNCEERIPDIGGWMRDCRDLTTENRRLSLDAIQARGGREEVMRLLAGWYFSSRREGWEEGEKEEEVISRVVDYFANAVSGEWPAGWDLELTLKAIGGDDE